MKKRVRILFLCALVAPILPSLPAQVRVDLAGFQSTIDGTRHVPVWWKDGVPQILPVKNEGEVARPTAITTDGTRVFISGTVGEPDSITRRPVLWVDGEYVELPTLPGQELGNSVPLGSVVYQDHLYTAGTAANLNTAAPVFWWHPADLSSKPQLHVLPFHSTYGAGIKAIAAGLDGVYFGGFTFTDSRVAKPCIWTVNMSASVFQPTILESNPDYTTIVLDVYVTPDGNVHAAGIQQDGRTFTPLYWLNGKKTVLKRIEGNETAEANGVTVSNVGDVIVSGWYQPNGNDPQAVVWVNGKMTALPSGHPNAMAHTLTNEQGIVAVAGSEYTAGDKDTPAWPVFWVGKDRFELGTLADMPVAQPTAGITILPADSARRK